MIEIKEVKKITNFEKGPIRRSLFSNGAVSLFHQFKGMESAVVNIYFLAGSIFEKPSEYGISHVIEHMLFKEAGENKIIKELEFAGAEINAYTYKEHVCFEMSCSAQKLAQFYPKFLSLFLNPHFDEKALELEKKVIIQELKEDGDDHETFGMEYLYKKNFDDKLGHSIGGSIKNVRSFKASDLMSFYKKYYTSDRLIISVCSGYEFKALESETLNIMQAYLPAKIKQPKRLKQSKKFSKLVHIKNKLKRKMESSIVFFSFDGISVHHKDYYPLLVLDDFLFEGMSSVFFDELREKLGLVYGMGSALNAYADEGSYIMVFNTKKTNVKLLNETIINVLRAIEHNQYDISEINRVIARIKEAWLLAFDSMGERCEYFAEVEMFAGNDFSVQRIIDKLDQVTIKDVQRVITRLFKYNYSRVILGK
tara:strand:+ start:104433 stop:105701 length:1269 start_codon:yes stop_codon:yes gene_type:complete